MSCNSCNSNVPTFFTYSFPGCSTSSPTCCTSQTDAQYIQYTGPNLLNIGADSNTDLQTILANIDTAVGSAIETNWADFNYFCLSDITTIDSAQSFAETISEYVCDLNTSLDTFISTTYADAIAALQASIDAINNPELTSCEAVGIVDTDTLNQALTKIINNLCSVNDAINPSGASWDTCYSIISAPTNITDAFDVLIAQICEQKAAIDAIEPLPVFNNVGSCLGAPLTTTDSLYDTVVKIRTLLCTLPEYDINDVTWPTCIDNPNPGRGADLVSSFNQILAYLSVSYQLRVVQWDNTFFNVTFYDEENPCSGYTVTLQDDVGLSDKFVALDSGDTNPDYLLNKMTAGANISFDTTTTPGTVIIDCDAEDNKVKANAGDTSNGYLIDKVAGKPDATGSIDLVQSYNATDDKVDLTPTFDFDVLTAQILTSLEGNSTLSDRLCALVCACGPCSGDVRYVMLRIVASGDPQDNTITLTQTNPVASFYSANTVLDDVTFDTGWYTVSSTDSTLTGTFSLTNNNVASTNYVISVVDTLGATVPGSSSASGTLGSAAILNINPFIYGTGVSNFIVKVQLSS